MSKVAIVTDTVSCLPPELARRLDIQIIPVNMIIDRKNYRDTDLSNEEFWKLFYQAKEPVTTNAANPSDFEAIFSRLARNTGNIVCILVSKKLSATNNSAHTAKEALKHKIPSLRIEVIDSMTATGAQGFIVLEAARASQAGKGLSEVLSIARDMIPKVKFLTAMQTLKYLIKSGRDPKSAVIGNWLNIKPLIGMVSGSGLVDNLGRERGMDRAIARIIDMVKEYADTRKPLHVMVHYTDDKSTGEKIRNTLLSRYNYTEIYLTPYTPVMASQTGPVVAIAFYS